MLYEIELQQRSNISEWREAAKNALAQNISPETIMWRPPGIPLTLAVYQPLPQAPAFTENTAFRIPKAFFELAESVICHNSPEKYGILYRVLWRLVHENKALLHYTTDDDIITLNTLAKAVNRDAYKIKAYLRFREITSPETGETHYIARYTPEHETLQRVLLFFTTRFRNMTWSIFTPHLAAHWDGTNLSTDNADSRVRIDHYPDDDAVEDYWCLYYRSTFNPARIKVQAMLSQMPKKYWPQLPEAQHIEAMLADAPRRVQAMLDVQKQLSPPL
jgi:uracil-DNA glycosylase